MDNDGKYAWGRKTSNKAPENKPSAFGGFWVDNDFTIRKGKHAGISLFDVKSSYFRWMLNEPTLASKMGILEKEVISLLLSHRRKMQEAKDARLLEEKKEQQEVLAGAPVMLKQGETVELPPVDTIEEESPLHDDLPF